ncbi:helix-turn-helix domain-containing protein [Roseovarius phycicola]|uniref:Helix-turn-helix domain-containing protein n=1 Tax=Roseovarius phycicola TaxID=3080976 RepID=A0ABZ2HJZ6_9RHOB
MAIQNEFGLTLRGIRNALGLSQLALAHRLGSTQRHISFLETGRSRATPEFLQRIAVELNLSTAQRSALFEASGLRNPFPERQLTDTEITQALDTIERRILQNWPFPAFALDKDWTILRANPSATAMFAMFGIDLSQANQSLLTMVLSPGFRTAILNWEEVSPGFYFRLMAAAERDRTVRVAFEAARASGLFDDVPRHITGGSSNPVMSCAEMGLPDGTRLRMTPFIGSLSTLQDVRLERIEIELMVPLDDVTETKLTSMFA